MIIDLLYIGLFLGTFVIIPALYDVRKMRRNEEKL